MRSSDMIYHANQTSAISEELVEGEVVHAASDLQFVVGRIKSLEGVSVTVEWESPLWIRSDGSSEVIVVQLDATPMRIMGNAIEVQRGA